MHAFETSTGCLQTVTGLSSNMKNSTEFVPIWTLHPTSQHLSQSYLYMWDNFKQVTKWESVEDPCFSREDWLALLVCDFDLDFFFRDQERERLSWCLPGNCGAKNQLWRRKNDFDQQLCSFMCFCFYTSTDVIRTFLFLDGLQPFPGHCLYVPFLCLSVLDWAGALPS